MNEYYTYQECLNIVEKFMIDSRIREYCETVCKGKCCENCYESSKACFKNEGRRLPCSIFICNSLRTLLNLNKKSKWYDVAIYIERTITSLLDSKTPYFNVNTPKVQKGFKIHKSLIDDLISENDGINKLEDVMRELIENKTQV